MADQRNPNPARRTRRSAVFSGRAHVGLPDILLDAQYLQFLWRSFRMASWLGWQIESNWADPFLFAVYSIIKPLAGAAILVVMYTVITNGKQSAQSTVKVEEAESKFSSTTVRYAR